MSARTDSALLHRSANKSKGESKQMSKQWSFAKRNLQRAACLLTAIGGLAAMPPAFAGPTINIDKDSFLWVGLYGRLSYATVENQAPNGTDWSNNFTLEEGRILMYAQAMKIGDKGDLSFEYDVDSDSGNTVRTLDDYVQFDFNDYFRFWFGRFVPPADRASMEAPAYTFAFDYPIASAWQIAFKSIRDNNAVWWGQIDGGMYKYYLGVSAGRKGGPNQKDDLKYELRLSADFLDPEPGYYPSLHYDGAKKIANIGFHYAYQKDGAGNVGLAGPGIVTAGNWKEYAFDYHLELPVAPGRFDSEGGWYDYDLGNVRDTSGFLVQGHGFYVEAGFEFPKKVGIGKIEPVAEFQQFFRSGVNAVGSQGKQQRFDLGLQYLIKGHDIRVDAFWFHEQQPTGQVPPGQENVNGVKILTVFNF
jgi:hypothetical protein